MNTPHQVPGRMAASEGTPARRASLQSARHRSPASMPRHKLAKTAVVRYSAPVIGGTAAAIVSSSPSTEIGTGGFGSLDDIGKGAQCGHVARTKLPPVGQHWREKASRPRRRRGPNNPWPEPRANARSSRKSLPAPTPAPAPPPPLAPRVNKPCGVRTGASIIMADASLPSDGPIFRSSTSRREIHSCQTDLAKVHSRARSDAAVDSAIHAHAHNHDDGISRLGIIRVSLAQRQRPAIQPEAARAAKGTCYGLGNCRARLDRNGGEIGAQDLLQKGLDFRCQRSVSVPIPR